MEVREFQGIDRSQDPVDLNPGRGVESLNTDYWQEGSFSPRDGVVRASFSGTYGDLVGSARSIIPVVRPGARSIILGRSSGTLAYAVNPDPEFSEANYAS